MKEDRFITCIKNDYLEHVLTVGKTYKVYSIGEDGYFRIKNDRGWFEGFWCGYFGEKDPRWVKN